MKEAIEKASQLLGPQAIANQNDQDRVLDTPWKKVDGYLFLYIRFKTHMVNWNIFFVPYNPLPGPEIVHATGRGINNIARWVLGMNPKAPPSLLIPPNDPGTSWNKHVMAYSRGPLYAMARSGVW
ncbi:uncharacterized protein PgNI_09116 [Pyricularia grisea]|uniref:Uncharacterized protein n=1 Tax=Pyricularia grisea TaxID=148305 RepID=A0A6P8ARG2_PYRGI|nr:uncharacterized protein PgNI_09116 [Pyricularia grisea]TLD04719.1 hypothetical protein PgNI_09116 [Pyricularia grisea]